MKRLPPTTGKCVYRRLGAGAVVALCGLVVAGCTASPAAIATTTTAATVPTTTTSTLPPTTVFQPTAPQASQDKAAAHLVAAWKAGDRAAAAVDASPGAVAAVFAQPYPAGGVQARGCSSAVTGPSFCVYRLLANGNLLSLSAVSGAGGWFISDAMFQS